MIKFLINAGFVLVFLFIFALIGSGMLWVIMKVMRSLFPKKFAPDKKREKDEV
jgi:Na+-transporting methylmalonyl-CoA/oxaloacetate decarboxylase gamma subunit